MHVEPIAKQDLRFFSSKLSNMKNVVFWSVTPCSLIGACIWFRENASLKWAAGSTETSARVSIVLAVSTEFRNTRNDFLWFLLTA
jgi:hypothetical protein